MVLRLWWILGRGVLLLGGLNGVFVSAVWFEGFSALAFAQPSSCERSFACGGLGHVTAGGSCIRLVSIGSGDEGFDESSSLAAPLGARLCFLSRCKGL